VKRAAIVSTEDFALGDPGSFQSAVGGDRDKGVERRVELLDQYEAVLGEFDGRDIAVAKFST
jgi:hypothetical protein